MRYDTQRSDQIAHHPIAHRQFTICERQRPARLTLNLQSCSWIYTIHNKTEISASKTHKRPAQMRQRPYVSGPKRPHLLRGYVQSQLLNQVVPRLGFRVTIGRSSAEDRVNLHITVPPNAAVSDPCPAVRGAGLVGVKRPAGQ